MDKTKRVFRVGGQMYRVKNPSKVVEYVSLNDFETFKQGVEEYFNIHRQEFTLIDNDGSQK